MHCIARGGPKLIDLVQEWRNRDIYRDSASGCTPDTASVRLLPYPAAAYVNRRVCWRVVPTVTWRSGSRDRR